MGTSFDMRNELPPLLERDELVRAWQGVLTKREIAERLFVTIHAVRFHLRNAYAKLQVGQRQELALALVDAEDMGAAD